MMLQLKIPEHIEPYWAEVTQTKYYTIQQQPVKCECIIIPF